MSDAQFREFWRIANEAAYILARRSVALLEFSISIEPLRDLTLPQSRLTRLIANSFEYLRIRDEDRRKRKKTEELSDKRSLEAKKKSQAPKESGFENEPN